MGLDDIDMKLPSAEIPLEVGVESDLALKHSSGLSLPKFEVEVEKPEADISFPSFSLPKIDKDKDHTDEGKYTDVDFPTADINVEIPTNISLETGEAELILPVDEFQVEKASDV